MLDAINEEKNKKKSNIPIAVKISPDIKNDYVEVLADLLVENSVDLVILSNTTDQNRDNLKNVNKLEKGGLSGKPLEKRSNDLIRNFYKIFKKKIKIIGVGGVDSGKSALEKILNGASLVQVYTGMVYTGPNIALEISNEISDILNTEGIKNISEIVGTKNWSWLVRS